MSTSPAPSVLYLTRLAALREAMRARGVEAVVLPSSDPHQSEYVAERWAVRQYFSGFSGSAGTAVVTLDGGGVWTDSRYYVQAPAELARTSGLAMMKAAQGGAEYVSWLAEHLAGGATVGIDARVFTVQQVRAIERAFTKTDLTLRTDVDLVDEVWPERPGLPSTPLFSHDVRLAGRSADDKLAELRAAMAEASVTHTFLTALDEIAWLLNVRASDIYCNPLAIAYALVGTDEVTLYTDGDRIDEATMTRFGESRITVKPCAAHERALTNLPREARVGIDEAQVNHHLAQLVPEAQYVAFASPLRRAKAIKNATEIEHIRAAHVKDGAALVRAFRWLEQTLAERSVRECEFVDVLARERAEGELYYGPSFDAIVGYGANGALPHYRSVEGEDAEIKPTGVLLVDSGGQYQDGTTDITRTFGLGDVTEAQRRNFTLVLKGMIALSRAIFPKGTRGAQLDTFARQHLWRDGLDYGHGTGHGVGFFLNVHEPPQGFAPNVSERGRTRFEAGMFTSNEPGYYEEGAYGIRIENLVLAVPAFPDEAGKEDFLRFETITYYPIDRALLDEALLTDGERAWLAAYHAEVLERLSPKLSAAEVAWLEEKCGGM